MRSIPGFNGYEITEDGVVYINGKIVEQKQGLRDSSPYVNLKRNNKTIRRSVASLVLTAYVSEAPNGSACPIWIDGNRRNNIVANLKWGRKKINALGRVEVKNVLS